MAQTILERIPTNTIYWAYQWISTNILEKCFRASQALQRNEVQSKTPQLGPTYNNYPKSYSESTDIGSSAQVWYVRKQKRTSLPCSKAWSAGVKQPGDWQQGALDKQTFPSPWIICALVSKSYYKIRLKISEKILRNKKKLKSRKWFVKINNCISTSMRVRTDTFAEKIPCSELI